MQIILEIDQRTVQQFTLFFFDDLKLYDGWDSLSTCTEDFNPQSNNAESQKVPAQ